MQLNDNHETTYSFSYKGGIDDIGYINSKTILEDLVVFPALTEAEGALEWI